MNADVYFAMGKTHQVCQDYGLAGMTPPPMTPAIVLDGDVDSDSLRRTFAVVCDGCSSSPHTDVGARLLAHSVAWGFDTFKDDLRLSRAVWEAEELRHRMQLPQQSLDATIMFLHETGDGHVRARVAGDGVVAGVRHDGVVVYWTIRYPSGAPGYLSYLLSKDRYETYLDQTGGGRMIAGSVLAPHEASDVWDEGDYAYDIMKLEDSEDFTWQKDFSRERFSMVVAMTDGVQSFQERDGPGFSPVPLEQVLGQVLGFKNLAGQFVSRRMRRFLGKYCRMNGWQHSDDVGVAAIHLEG